MLIKDPLLEHALQAALVLDNTNMNSEHDPLYAFALDELLCRKAGQNGQAICHIWRHPSAFIMGLRDSRLPQAGMGQRWLESQGWHTAVRHSGGAAVPLDRGVVNVSLILPMNAEPSSDYKLDFERMYRLIAEAVQLQCSRTSAIASSRVDKGEIAGAYCPGEYDLSIAGYKFCGIAQRRQTRAFIVQAFVVAEGSGRERAQLVRSFYNLAAYAAPSQQYPLVQPDSTRSLGELLSASAGGAAGFISAVKETVARYQSAERLMEAADQFVMPTQEEVRSVMERLHSRYAVS